MNEQFGNFEQLARADAAGGLNEQSGNSGQLQGEQQGAGDALNQAAEAAYKVLQATGHLCGGDPFDNATEDDKAAMRRVAAAALAARQPVVQEPVGTLTIWHFRGSSAMENTDFDYTGSLPPGSHALYTAPPAPEMSPDFTDTARAAIAWVLWHHQGGSSAIGQPLRYALGMGDHDELSAQQVSEAKRYAALVGARTDDFKQYAPAAAVPVDGLYQAARLAIDALSEFSLYANNDAKNVDLWRLSQTAARRLAGALAAHPQPAAAMTDEQGRPLTFWGGKAAKDGDA
ncbi:hypothetical protein [Xanthomonas campestris]|uniref:hypothetical protein n=1 Tax=Xanthomonas campestris TaxID=339 RepID=UPI000E1F05BA|nr:hypothetical protein [Xanthomonas campestris]